MPTKRSTVQPSQKVARRLRALLDFHAMRPVELARRVGVTPPVRQSVAIGHGCHSGLGALLGALEEHLGGERLRRLESVLEKDPGSFRMKVTKRRSLKKKTGLS